MRTGAGLCLLCEGDQPGTDYPTRTGVCDLTPQPIHLRAGACIEYRLHLFGIPFSWHTEIQCWNPPEAFVDVQRRGPYTHWVHTHHFREAQGATIIEDEVQYALPYSAAGGTRLSPRASPVVPDLSVPATRHPGVFFRRNTSALTSTGWNTRCIQSV
jgi:hypothetical protein